MRFQQIKDLLSYLEQVHHQLGLCYGRLMAEVDGERSRMLLAYLRGREDEASAHLHDYQGQLSQGVKETWLERGFSEDLLPEIQRLARIDSTRPHRGPAPRVGVRSHARRSEES